MRLKQETLVDLFQFCNFWKSGRKMSTYVLNQGCMKEPTGTPSGRSSVESVLHWELLLTTSSDCWINLTWPQRGPLMRSELLKGDLWPYILCIYSSCGPYMTVIQAEENQNSSCWPLQDLADHQISGLRVHGLHFEPEDLLKKWDLLQQVICVWSHHFWPSAEKAPRSYLLAVKF